MAEEKAVQGAPAGVTFDFGKDSDTTTNGPQPEQTETQQAAPEAPKGVQFDWSKAQSLESAAPKGVQFDWNKAKPLEQPQDYKTAAAGATTISARPHDFHSWLQDVQADVKNGSATTWVGSLLKRLGAKGSSYGTPEALGDFMAGPVSGVPKVLEGTIEAKEAAEPVVKDIAAGHTATTAVAAHPESVQKAEIGANKIIGGGLQSLSAAGLIVAPEGQILAAAVPGMAIQSQVTKAALHMGADPDTAELIGNVAGVTARFERIPHLLTPTVERFGVAVNNRTAAEVEYTNRSRNLETARAQAAEAQQRAIQAAQDETDGFNGAIGPDGKRLGSPEQTIQARQLANEAAKNVGDAQKAFDQASKNRADATIELEKLGRKITSAADKVKAAEYERTASDNQKAMDLVKKAVPSKGANRYSDEDMQAAFAHVEEAKARGEKVTDLPTFYNAVEEGRQGIEDNLFQKSEPYKNEPVTTDPEKSPKLVVAQKLDEMAKVDGNFENAMDTLGEFNITDPTVGEAKDMITKLNNYQRAAMKGANNWDIYNMIETSPQFAARFFMADALREALHDNLEGHGIENSKAARAETAQLVRVRDAAGAQIRANRGGTSVRGSGSQSRLRGLVAKLVGKAGRTAGAGVGAEMAGPAGAVVGSLLAGEAVEPVEQYIAPRDMTRDEHIAKAFKNKSTSRTPTKITGQGTAAVIPNEPIPPMPKAVPETVELTPREDTDLHADLAAHYGVTDLNSTSYQEMEDNLRKDIDVKIKNGQEPSSSEKSLLSRVLKADAADRAALKQSNISAATALAKAEAEAKAAKTPGQLIDELEAQAAEKAAGEATPGLNPHLVSLGRGDESDLVSHSVAMKAHSPAAEISGLGQGVTSEHAHMHEWAHHAMDAVEGEPTGIEIRSDKHPKSQPGAGATSVFDTSKLQDENGNVDTDALEAEMVKRISQKMAGPASHEVFGGMTKEEAMSHPATKSDLRQARSTVRMIHPDWTTGQVEEFVGQMYERARDFLSQPHIADRIKANAAVREDNLHESLHASRGRVSQFQKDILEAHNEQTGTTEPGPDSGGAGEGGEKSEKPAEAGEEKNAGGDKGGRGEVARKGDGTGKESGREAVKFKGGTNAAGNEATARKATTEQKIESLQDTNNRLNEMLRAGKGTPEEQEQARARIAENNVLMKDISESKITRVPTERTTGKPETDEAIRKGGAIPGGVQPGFEYVDKATGQTKTFPDLALFHDPESGTTLAHPRDAVTSEIIGNKLQESRAQYAAAKKGLGESNIDHEDVLDNIRRTYGVHDDPKLEHQAGFITPDARHIDLPSSVMHSDAIEDAGGEKAEGIKDNRADFINNTGTIRVHQARERGGKVLAFSVPADGVTPEQMTAMQKSVAANADRNGILRMERADISPETRNTLHAEAENPTPANVPELLRKIDAHPGGKSEQGPTVGEATQTGVKTAQAESEAAAEAARREQERQYNKFYTPGGRLRLGESNIEKPGVVQDLSDTADEFNKTEGREPINEKKLQVDPRQMEMADAYAAGEHAPNDPAVKKAYQSFKNDIDRQFELLGKHSIKVDAFDHDPYEGDTLGVGNDQSGAEKAYNALRKDVIDNHHVSVWKGGAPPADHPLSEVDPKTGLTYNEKLRAIHDVFGHVVPDNGFDAAGEESAWGVHNQMFSPESRAPLATETRAQTAYVTKHGEFANQKAMIMPKEFQVRPEDMGQTESTENRSMPFWWNDQLQNDVYGGKTKGGQLVDDAAKNGGFTVHPRTGEAPTNGYMVEVKPTSRVELDGNPKTTDILDFVNKNRPDFDKDPNLYAGGYHNGQSGKFELNVAKNFDNVDGAIAAAKKNNQISIWDVKNGKEIPTGGTGELTPEMVGESQIAKSPKGSSVPLMTEPLEVKGTGEKGTGEKGKISTLDVAKALNEYSQKENPALELGEAEPKEMVARAKKIAEDEAKYQLAQGKTGTEWYTTEMKDHDKALQGMRPELAGGEMLDSIPDHPVKLSLFKAAEAVLSSGQKPYGNFKSAVKAWDAYNETGEFPRLNPETGKSWGPRGVAAYGNALDMITRLVNEKGEKGAAEWLLADHPVSELKGYNKSIKGTKTDMRPGAMILGEKRGPFMQNLHGIESAFTADMWVSRTWNRWMGTIEFGKNKDGDMEITSDSPRNGAERDLMKQSFSETADNLGLTTSSLQAVLWYYEQSLYSKQGIPKESWSFRDAAERVAKEEGEKHEEQNSFNFGENDAKMTGGLGNLSVPRPAGGLHAFDLIHALGAAKK